MLVLGLSCNNHALHDKNILFYAVTIQTKIVTKYITHSASRLTAFSRHSELARLVQLHKKF